MKEVLEWETRVNHSWRMEGVVEMKEINECLSSHGDFNRKMAILEISGSLVKE